MTSLWSDPALQKLFLSNTPLIDVRAPVEFLDGSIPHSINLPLLTDSERHEIGICYKAQGPEAAIKLGHKLVTGQTKDLRVKAWMDFIHANPTAEVFCFRGGLRSQISCQWISEAGTARSPIPGGYKRLRQFFLSWINEAPKPKLMRLGGLTGSGKTTLLKTLPHHADLEEFAHHRGSAFGNIGPQPSQITFENLIGLSLLKNPQHLLLEDESIGLGKIFIPKDFFALLQLSPMAILRTPLKERIQNIFQDYVLVKDADFFLGATQSIGRKLGGLRLGQMTEKIHQSFLQEKTLNNHEEWISSFLLDYYDPLYQKGLVHNKELIVFEGGAEELREWWLETTLSVNPT